MCNHSKLCFLICTMKMVPGLKKRSVCAFFSTPGLAVLRNCNFEGRIQTLYPVLFSRGPSAYFLCSRRKCCDLGPVPNLAVTQQCPKRWQEERVPRDRKERGSSSATRPALLPNQAPETPALPLGRGADKGKEASETSTLGLPQVKEEPGPRRAHIAA